VKILLVGADGHVARCVGDALLPDYDLRLLVHRAASGLAGEDIFGDVRDPDDVARAMAGADIVIHFAIARYSRSSRESEVSVAQAQFDVNVKGVYNVVETAAQCGVKRLIYTSSMTVPQAARHPAAGDRLMTEGRAFRLAVEATVVGFEVFHIFADVPGLKWDNSKAKRLLGFTAEHGFEQFWSKTDAE